MRKQTALIGTLAAFLHLGAAVVQAQNTAYGPGALQRNGGSANTAIGNSALYHNTSGSNNTAVGHGTLPYNNGSLNTAVGFQALYSNTNGHHNTAIGSHALDRNQNGIYNTALGFSTLYANIDGNSNTALGFNVLVNNSHGSQNTALGTNALYFLTTGGFNTAIGYEAGYNLKTGDNNIYLHHPGVPTESGTIRLGNSTMHLKTYLAGTVHASTVVITSDARLKTNITPLSNVLEKVKQLHGVSYDWNDEYKAVNRGAERREIGVLAQDVEAVFPELVTMWGEGYKAVEYGKLSGVLVEAIKELQADTEARLAAKDAHVTTLETRLAEMDGRLVALERELATSRQANAGHGLPMQWANVGTFTSGPLVGGLLLAGWAFGRYRAGRRPW